MQAFTRSPWQHYIHPWTSGVRWPILASTYRKLSKICLPLDLEWVKRKIMNFYSVAFYTIYLLKSKPKSLPTHPKSLSTIPIHRRERLHVIPNWPWTVKDARGTQVALAVLQQVSFWPEDEENGGSELTMSSQLRKTRSMDSSCLELRLGPPQSQSTSAGLHSHANNNGNGHSQAAMSRARSEANIHSSTLSLGPGNSILFHCVDAKRQYGSKSQLFWKIDFFFNAATLPFLEWKLFNTFVSLNSNGSYARD